MKLSYCDTFLWKSFVQSNQSILLETLRSALDVISGTLILSGENFSKGPVSSNRIRGTSELVSFGSKRYRLWRLSEGNELFKVIRWVPTKFRMAVTLSREHPTLAQPW